MPARPSITGAQSRSRVAEIAAKRDIDKTTNRDADMTADHETDKSVKSDIEESIPHAVPLAAASAPVAKPATIGPLPKLTMYLHRDVIKALKRLAVEDEVQVQDILRTALRDHLAKRGHRFTDLTTGK